MSERHKALFEALEPRILLSATPLPEDYTSTAISVDNTENQATAETIVHEVLFIDTNVENYENLIDDLTRNVEVIFINADEDGLAKISDILAGRQDLSAIHILSHGSVGEVNLGTSQLTSENLSTYQEQLNTWGNSLTNDGDILIYGCDVGQDSTFIADLADLTGADIAASNDLTGDASQVGDAELEVEVGLVETTEVLEQTAYNEARVILASTPVTLLSEGFENPDVTGYNNNTAPANWVGSTEGYGATSRGIFDEGDQTVFSTTFGEQAYLLDYTNSGLTSATSAISDTLVVDTTYTLTFNVAVRAGESSNYHVEFVAFETDDDDNARQEARGGVGTVLATATGSVSTNDMSTNHTLVFNTNSSTSHLGKSIGVRLIKSSGDVLYDNIKVTALYPDGVSAATNPGSIETTHIGETVDVELTFDGPMTLTSGESASVTLLISNGTTDQEVTASATGDGSTNTSLTFTTASLASGYSDFDGIKVKANSLTYTPGDFKDGSGFDALTTFAEISLSNKIVATSTQVVTLIGDEANTTSNFHGASFGDTLADALTGLTNDSFTYDPTNPGGTLPGTGPDFHGLNAALTTLAYTFDAQDSLFIDIYGPNATTNRDDFFNVEFYLDGALQETVTGGISDGINRNTRVSASADTVANSIRIVETAGSPNFFSLSEIRLNGRAISEVTTTASSTITEAVEATAQNLSNSGTVSFTNVNNDDIDVSFSSNGDIAWSNGTIDAGLGAQLVAGFATSGTNITAPSNTPWTYSVTGADLDFLATGETIAFSYTVIATDSSGSTATDTVSFSITGTNNAPTISGTTTGSVTEDSAVVDSNIGISGTLSISDDTTDLHTATVVADGGNTLGGTLTMATTSALVVDASTSFDTKQNASSYSFAQSIDATLSDKLVVTVSVEEISATAVSSITYNGIALTEAVQLHNSGGSTSGLVAIFYLDNPASNGSLVVNLDGVANDISVGMMAISGVHDGHSLTDTSLASSASLTTTEDNMFVVAAHANTDHSGADSSANLTELYDYTREFSGGAGFTTVSTAGSTSPTFGGGTSNAATVAVAFKTLQATGVWNYEVANSATQFLAAGQSVTETFTVTVADDDGSSIDQDITITVNGANDLPIISVESGDSATATITETNNTITTNGTLTLTDLDTTNTVTVAATTVVESGTTSGIYNTTLLNMLSLTTGDILSNIENNDTFSWTFNSAGEAFDYLENGQSLTLTYTVIATDSLGTSNTQLITLTINGSEEIVVETPFVAPIEQKVDIEPEEPSHNFVRLEATEQTVIRTSTVEFFVSSSSIAFNKHTLADDLLIKIPDINGTELINDLKKDDSDGAAGIKTLDVYDTPLQPLEERILIDEMPEPDLDDAEKPGSQSNEADFNTGAVAQKELSLLNIVKKGLTQEQLDNRQDLKSTLISDYHIFDNVG